MRAHSAVVFCMILACKTAPQPGTNASATNDRSSSPGDRQKDEQAIQEAESRWRKTLNARDTAAIVTFYTEDAIYAPQGSPAYQGRDSVTGRWSQEFRIQEFKLERTPLRVEVAKSGDLANEVGAYTVRYRDKGQVVEGGGTYMTAWRKLDGAWKIASYMWNRNQPESGR